MDVFVIATNEQLEFEGEAGDFYGKTDWIKKNILKRKKHNSTMLFLFFNLKSSIL
jgi:hypothetical protein